jgi:hypothetical protein
VGKLVKIKSATILETVIALTIILVIFSIASTILVNTTISSIPVQKIKGREILKLYSAKTKLEKAFFDEEIKEGEFIINRQVKIDLYTTSLLKIQYSIFSANKIKIDGWQELVQQ